MASNFTGNAFFMLMNNRANENDGVEAAFHERAKRGGRARKKRLLSATVDSKMTSESGGDPFTS